MPTEDESKYGRLKDHLSVLIDAVESKMVSLKLTLAVTSQRDSMVVDLISNNDLQLEEIRSMLFKRDESTKNIMRDVITGVEASLFSLGLDEDQEKSLISMLDKGAAKIENLPDFGVEIEKSFVHARNSLEELMSKNK